MALESNYFVHSLATHIILLPLVLSHSSNKHINNQYFLYLFYVYWYLYAVSSLELLEKLNENLPSVTDTLMETP